MIDRADEVAARVVQDAYISWPGDNTGADGEPGNIIEHFALRFATALRAYAEEARQEERIIAAKESQMRYEDGYTCGANDERALWVKGEKK